MTDEDKLREGFQNLPSGASSELTAMIDRAPKELKEFIGYLVKMVNIKCKDCKSIDRRDIQSTKKKYLEEEWDITISSKTCPFREVDGVCAFSDVLCKKDGCLWKENEAVGVTGNVGRMRDMNQGAEEP